MCPAGPPISPGLVTLNPIPSRAYVIITVNLLFTVMITLAQEGMGFNVTRPALIGGPPGHMKIFFFGSWPDFRDFLFGLRNLYIFNQKVVAWILSKFQNRG